MRLRTRIFFLTREQWAGVIVLLCIALSTVVALHYMPHPEDSSKSVVNDSTRAAYQAQKAEAIAQAKAANKAKWDSIRQVRRDSIAKARQRTISRHPFDPNTADSATLVEVGLEPWQAHNMLRYRSKNGRYRKPEDMKRLYGMTDSLYLLLEPWIHIDTLALKADKPIRDTLQHADTIVRYQSTKRDTVINLRTADTTTLKMIRGIGSYRAREIVRYREALGGYTNIEQVMEIRAMQKLNFDSIRRHLMIDTVIVKTIAVNHLRPEQMRHPYLSFTQAKELYELRRKKVRLHSLDELQGLKSFDENDLFRIKAYLSFED